MNLFIISDLHICGPDDSLYSSLLRLLREKAKPNDIVVCAGDIFDLFVGSKSVFLQRYSEFLSALGEAGTRGVKLHYIEGNHDFLIHRAFQGIQGLTVHSREMSLEIQGKRFLLLHGDTVDRSDYSYLILRTFFRSPVMKILITLIPGKWLDLIGHSASHRSRKYRELTIERLEELRKIYRNYAVDRLAQGYDFVVMGHCHDLDEMFFKIDGRIGQYINVGFPRIHGSFLTWTPGEDKIHREKLP